MGLWIDVNGLDKDSKRNIAYGLENWSRNCNVCISIIAAFNLGKANSFAICWIITSKSKLWVLFAIQNQTMNWQSFATAALSPVVIAVSRRLRTSIWTGLKRKWRVVNCWRSSCEIVWTRSAFGCKFIWSTREGVRLNGGIDGPTWLVTGAPDVAGTAALTADSKSSVFPHIALWRAFQSFVWHSLGNIPQRDENARLSRYSLTWSNTRWHATRIPYTWNTPWISRRPPHVDHNRNKHNACPVGGHSRYKQLYHLRPGFGLLLSSSIFLTTFVSGLFIL